MALAEGLREELHELLLAAHEQTLTASQTRRLDELVCNDLEAAWFYLTAMDTFATLAWHRGNAPSATPDGDAALSERVVKLWTNGMNVVEYARGEKAIRQTGGAEIELPSPFSRSIETPGIR